MVSNRGWATHYLTADWDLLFHTCFSVFFFTSRKWYRHLRQIWLSINIFNKWWFIICAQLLNYTEIKGTFLNDTTISYDFSILCNVLWDQVAWTEKREFSLTGDWSFQRFFFFFMDFVKSLSLNKFHSRSIFEEHPISSLIILICLI